MTQTGYRRVALVYCRPIPPQDEFLSFRHRFVQTRFSIFTQAILGFPRAIFGKSMRVF